MSQRLVIHLCNNDEMSEGYGNVFASLYFHWSAFPIESLDEIYTFLGVFCGLKDDEKVQKIAQIPDLTLRAIRTCEYLGGGLHKATTKFAKEREYVQHVYPGEEFKTTDICRNKGLICVSPCGNAAINEYAAGECNIYFDSMTNPSIYNIEIEDPIIEGLLVSTDASEYNCPDCGVNILDDFIYYREVEAFLKYVKSNVFDNGVNKKNGLIKTPAGEVLDLDKD